MEQLTGMAFCHLYNLSKHQKETKHLNNTLDEVKVNKVYLYQSKQVNLHYTETGTVRYLINLLHVFPSEPQNLFSLQVTEQLVLFFTKDIHKIETVSCRIEHIKQV